MHVVHIHGVGQHARGGALSGGFGMHGRQQPPDLMLTSIDEGHQRELLRGVQLTRDFLRTLQQAPQLTRTRTLTLTLTLTLALALALALALTLTRRRG